MTGAATTDTGGRPGEPAAGAADPRHAGPLGWLGRLGALAPGIVHETEPLQFYRLAPPGLTLLQTSLGLRDATVAENLALLPRIDEAAALLAARGAGCVLLQGSPPVVVGGYGSDRALTERMRAATGVPAGTEQGACVDALRLLGVRRPAVVTPFPDDLNRLLVDFLERSGLSVAGVGSLRASGVAYRDLMGLPVADLHRLALATCDAAPDADGLYVTGAPLPAVPLVDPLERALGVPVVTSLQATLWHGLRLLGLGGLRVEGCGRLLRELP